MPTIHWKRQSVESSRLMSLDRLHFNLLTCSWLGYRWVLVHKDAPATIVIWPSSKQSQTATKWQFKLLVSERLNCNNPYTVQLKSNWTLLEIEMKYVFNVCPFMVALVQLIDSFNDIFGHPHAIWQQLRNRRWVLNSIFFLFSEVFVNNGMS